MSVFQGLLIHTATIQKPVRTLTDKEPYVSYTDSATNVRCRMVPKSTSSFASMMGIVTGDRKTMFLEASEEIDEGYRVIFDDKTYKVVSVTKLLGLMDYHHIEVELEEIKNG